MRVYLDHNATTPVDPAVRDAMLPFLSGDFGNASSIHTPGQQARAAVETAREQVAALIGAKPQEIVFTSGGTESDNHAIFGCLFPSASSISSASLDRESTPRHHNRHRTRSCPQLLPGTRAPRRRCHLSACPSR